MFVFGGSDENERVSSIHSYLWEPEKFNQTFVSESTFNYDIERLFDTREEQSSGL